MEHINDARIHVPNCTLLAPLVHQAPQSNSTHDRRLQLANPDVLSLVGGLLSGYGSSSSYPHIVFTVFMYLFVFEMQRLSLFS